MNEKVKKQRFLEYLWLLLTPKKFIKGHLLRPGSGSGPRRPDPNKKARIRPKRSGSDQKRPDPTGSGSATLLYRVGQSSVDNCCRTASKACRGLGLARLVIALVEYIGGKVGKVLVLVGIRSPPPQSSWDNAI
jgi:hypothetical protein